MLDLKALRKDPETYRRGLETVGAGDMVDRLLALDTERREAVTRQDALRTEKKKVSDQVRQAKGPAARDPLVAESRRISGELEGLEARVKELDAQLAALLLEVPNLPEPDVPVGPDESANVITRQPDGLRCPVGFEPKPHWDLMPALGVLEMERGVKIAGSRFYALVGAGARLQRALIQFMLDLHVGEHGYLEVYPPAVVREKCLVGTGQLPKFGENLYHDAEEDFWLAPTAEVTVTNLFREEILPPDALPLNLVAYSPCFRREKMSAGKDTRGIKRGHQFDKVELVKLVAPGTGREHLDQLVAHAVAVLTRLQIPYRIVQMCTGDLSFTAAAKHDVEAWAPGCGEWLEVSSCSFFRDFQARRAEIRFRPRTGGKAEYAHTLNGSGLALPRTLIAVVENYQQPDGSIRVPDALRPYLGGQEVLAPDRRLP